MGKASKPAEEAKRGGAAALSDKRGGAARAISAMLPQVGGKAFRRFGFVQHAVVSRWREIVGPKFADVSAPESIRFPQGKRAGGTLNLVVEGAFAPMMQHLEPAIVERVNAFFGYGAITRVAMRQGRVAANREAPCAPVSLRPIPAELGDSIRPIADPELRACLEGLARSVAETSGPPIFETIPIPFLGRLSEK